VRSAGRRATARSNALQGEVLPAQGCQLQSQIRANTVCSIAFLRIWGTLQGAPPGDLSLSLGYPTIPPEPYPPEMQRARDRVLAACRKNGIAFLQSCTADNVIARIEEGVRVIAGHSEESAIKGRAHQKRKLPV